MRKWQERRSRHSLFAVVRDVHAVDGSAGGASGGLPAVLHVVLGAVVLVGARPPARQRPRRRRERHRQMGILHASRKRSYNLRL